MQQRVIRRSVRKRILRGSLRWLSGLLVGAALFVLLRTPFLRLTSPPLEPQLAPVPTTPILAPSTASIPPTLVPVRTFQTALLEERFENPNASGLRIGQVGAAAYAIVDGAYRITVKEPNYTVWSPIGDTYTSAALQVDVIFSPPTAGAFENTTAAGILFNYQDEKNFCLFNITADGYYALDLQKEGQRFALIDWTMATEIHEPGKPNRLRIEVASDRIRLYVNDVLLDEASDDTFRGGGVALAVSTFDQRNVSVMFDNFEIWGK